MKRTQQKPTSGQLEATECPVMTNTVAAGILLAVIRQLCTDTSAVCDTIWMPGGPRTVVDELCDVAGALGATNAEMISAIGVAEISSLPSGDTSQ